MSSMQIRWKVFTVAFSIAVAGVLVAMGPADLRNAPDSPDVISEVGPTDGEAELDRLLEEAVAATDRGDYARAASLYREVELAGEGTPYEWTGVSGQVSVARIASDTQSALAVTARVTRARPDLAGLLAIWDGDTFAAAGDKGRAAERYRYALDRHGDDVIDGRPVGVTALSQLGAVELDRGNAAAAANAERQLLAEYAAYLDPEAALARALLFDAVASGGLSREQLADFLNPEAPRATDTPVTLQAGQLQTSSATEAVSLRGAYGITFILTPSDSHLLERAEGASRSSTEGSLACTVQDASNGFAVPFTHSHFGYEFMDYPDCCSGWHPGVDLNASGDCDLDFRSVARGCVRDIMSSSTDWGTVTVEHKYLPSTWVSQYGHGDRVYVSVGQSVSKGTRLGNTDDVATQSCHLHHEIREADHSNLTDASSYRNTPQSRVGDWFQEPLSFIASHRSYQWVRWIDEGAFTKTGTWNTVSGIGNQDDMMWAATTSTSLTRYARYSFTPPGSGTHELWVFVPWTNSTSTKAPVKLVKS